MHVGAAYGSRSWPADRFAAVARALAGAGPDGRADRFGGRARARHRDRRGRGAARAANLAGRTGLAELAALVADAALVVTVDTGAAHLATAYATPSVVLFGPATVARWGPPAEGPHVVLTDERVRVGDAFGAEPDPALLAVGPDDVLRAAEALLVP